MAIVNISRQIVVTLQVEGFHCWPQAPDEVDFLRHRHRHIFHIKCWKNVTHGDRDIEIILFKRAMIHYLNKRYNQEEIYLTPILEFESKSCEQLAEELCVKFDLSACEVLEDGENGAYVQYNSKPDFHL